MQRVRWVVVVGALVVALAAFYVLMRGAPVDAPRRANERSGPALDDIDAKSREAMRELLRDADEGS